MNRNASGFDHPLWEREIRRQLFRSELDFVQPTNLEGLRLELMRTVENPVDVVVSVGGDGTANTLIQELGGTGIPFLIIPAGTANDLARELGIVGRVEEAVQCIRQSEPREIDLIRVNGQCMATNGGIGIASSVAESINRLRQQVPGFKKVMRWMNEQIYSLTLASELLSPRMSRLKLELETSDGIHEVETYQTLINNQPQLGGSFTVAPWTSNRDGHFNVTVFRHGSRLDFMTTALRVRMGQDPATDSDVMSFETSRLKIRVLDAGNGAPGPVPFFGDGEILSVSREFDIEILPRALKVYHPDRRKTSRNVKEPKWGRP